MMSDSIDNANEVEPLPTESQQRRRSGWRLGADVINEPSVDDKADERRPRRRGRSAGSSQDLSEPPRREPEASTDTALPASTESALATGGASQPEVQENNNDVAYWEERINEHIGWTVQHLVELGKLFLEAKAKLQRGDWQLLFSSGRLRFSLRWAQKLMFVAKNAALANAKNSALLPPSPDALSSLARVEPEVIQQAIDGGSIHREMTIGQAKEFAGRHQTGEDAESQTAFNYDRALESIVGRVKKALEKVPADQVENMVKDLTKVIRQLSHPPKSNQA